MILVNHLVEHPDTTSPHEVLQWYLDDGRISNAPGEQWSDNTLMGGCWCPLMSGHTGNLLTHIVTQEPLFGVNVPGGFDAQGYPLRPNGKIWWNKIQQRIRQFRQTTQQTNPGWKVLAAQAAREDPEGNEAHSFIDFDHATIWPYFPDVNGRQQTQIHQFQGHAPWPERV